MIVELHQKMIPEMMLKMIPEMMPKYCYFKPERHPGLDKRMWATTESKKVTIKQKLDEITQNII
jgi:hypothetical protein